MKWRMTLNLFFLSSDYVLYQQTENEQNLTVEKQSSQRCTVNITHFIFTYLVLYGYHVPQYEHLME